MKRKITKSSEWINIGKCLSRMRECISEDDQYASDVMIMTIGKCTYGVYLEKDEYLDSSVSRIFRLTMRGFRHPHFEADYLGYTYGNQPGWHRGYDLPVLVTDQADLDYAYRMFEEGEIIKDVVKYVIDGTRLGDDSICVVRFRTCSYKRAFHSTSKNGPYSPTIDLSGFYF